MEGVLVEEKDPYVVGQVGQRQEINFRRYIRLVIAHESLHVVVTFDDGGYVTGLYITNVFNFKKAKRFATVEVPEALVNKIKESLNFLKDSKEELRKLFIQYAKGDA